MPDKSSSARRGHTGLGRLFARGLPCPDCGRPIRDPDAARLGFCDRCREFTAMCGAGRRVVCPDLMTRTSWHMPCTSLGAVAWDIPLSDGRRRILLCELHDAEVRAGEAPWIGTAAPVAG